MLAPVTEARLAEQSLLELGLVSAREYPAFVEELRDASGIDPGYLRAARCSSPATATRPRRSSASSSSVAASASPSSGCARARRGALEPALAPTLRLALEVPDDHAIDPRKLTAALAVALVRDGGELRAGVQVEAVATLSSGRVDGRAARRRASSSRPSRW